MISEGSCDTEDWKFSFTITGIKCKTKKNILNVLQKNYFPTQHLNSSVAFSLTSLDEAK